MNRRNFFKLTAAILAALATGIRSKPDSPSSLKLDGNGVPFLDISREQWEQILETYKCLPPLRPFWSWIDNTRIAYSDDAGKTWTEIEV